MTKQMIVNATATEEIRVAIVDKKKLLDLDFETQSRQKQKGNIYKGIVANVEDSLEAAFIEFGEDKQGFLALSEIRPGLYPEHLRGRKQKVKISEILTRGQEIVVQVTKDEIGTKGAAVTSYLSLPGRFVVLMHSDDSGGGISRKIDDERARRRARDMLSRLDVPGGMAVIIRTAGMKAKRADLYRDLKALCREWENIDRGAQLGRAPTLLYREPDLVIRTIRDYLSPDVKKIVIDSEEEYEDAREYMQERMPDLEDLIEKHSGRQPVFEAYGIESAIEELFHREVRLPSGGAVCIDQTEALVAIDVNSGKSTKEQDHEATVYKTNLEAAQEVARQLRLRDLGGIVVIDFIDMVSRRHERDVERALRDAMRADKAKVKIGRISENGTLEITRQRLRQAHRLISFTPCPHCEGTGVVRDPEGLAVNAFRQIHGRLARSKKDLARLSAKVPLAVANVLNNKKRAELLELASEHQLELEVVADARLSGGEIRFEDETRGQAGLAAAHGIKDPRLEGDGRRRGRRRRKDEVPLTALKSTPPPSIGPVPIFLESDDVLFADEPEEHLEELEAAPSEGGKKASEPKEPKHYDDPLTEALFGDAPEIELEAAEVPAELAEVKPKRKRRRRRRRRKDRDEAMGAEVEASEGGEAESPAAEGEAAEAAGEDKPEGKRRRSRRSRRGGRKADEAAEASGDEAPAEAGAEAAAEPVEAAPAEAKSEDDEAPAPAKKPRARRAKKAEASKAPAEAEAAEAASADEEAPAPKKPARKRRTKKVVEADAAAVEAAGDEAAAKADDEAKEAPVKKAKRPRRTKKAAEAEAAEAAPAEDAPAKPKRKSRAKKVAEPEAKNGEAKAEGADDGEAPAKPARKTTRRRKTEAAAVAESPAE